MNLFSIPWLELSILLALVGSLCVSCFREPLRAFRWGLGFTGAVLGCTLLAWLDFGFGSQDGPRLTLQPNLFGRQLLRLDELSAPMVALVALLHFLTALATGRTKMRRYSLTWSMASEAIRLATFSSTEPGPIMALLAAGTIPAFIELINREKPTRVYLLHMGAFVALLVVAAVFYQQEGQEAWATIPLLAAVLIRCGTVPAHCWLTDWFEHASFGNALLFVTPLTGVYAAVRLGLPAAPDWVLRVIGIISLVTAVYAAGMATVQKEARRFFAYLFISHTSLVLIGMELHTHISLTGALALWVSAALSLHGFGLTLRALEARFGRMSLADYHGLYGSTPTLAVCFMVMGLASVGFPGTLGFISAELLVDGAIEANLFVGLVVVLAGALNGIAVVRAYFLLFTGTRHVSSVSLNIGLREWIAVLTLTVLVVGGGLVPQPGIASRHRAANEILAQRGQEVEPDQHDFEVE